MELLNSLVMVLVTCLQIQKFLSFVKTLYRDLAGHTAKIFEPRGSYKVKDLCEAPIDTWINEVYISTPIITEKRNDNQPVTVCYSTVSYFTSIVITLIVKHVSSG